MAIPGTMLALTFDEAANKLDLRRDYPVPSPAEGEALVQVILAQICSTVRTARGLTGDMERHPERGRPAGREEAALTRSHASRHYACSVGWAH
eukprot:365684-Chlamydomonas_euryale.AAC.4